MNNWDFDCPQFVDFAAALDNDVFYDASGDVQETDASENNDLGPKIATPKVKAGDHFSTDDEKLAKKNLCKLPARLSKRDGHLDQIFKTMKSPDDKGCQELPQTKRRSSFPMNNIKRRRAVPITPNCLKRTLNSKSKLHKTSEELELLKIAEMRNTLQRHLRLNKINLKRLKLNKAPFTLEKLPRKIEPKAQATKSNLLADQKPASKFIRNPNLGTNFRPGTTAFSRGVKDQLKMLQDEEKPTVVVKKSAPSNVLRDLNSLKNDCGNALKKQPLFEKYTAHSGIKFLPHQEKTVPQPFSFDASYSSSHNASQRKANLSKVHDSSSLKNTSCISDNKENLVK